MSYFVIEIQTDNEAKTSKAIYEYPTHDEALKIFHQKMASGITAGLAGNISKTLVLVLNSIGNTVIKDMWEKPAPIPEPEEETEEQEEPET